MTCSRRQILAGSALGMGVALPMVSAETAYAATKVIATKKVPVGGGVVVAKHRVVVTQPKKGKFHVFSAVCTHAGCLVNEVSDRRIECPCHDSEFSITNGAVLAGPASQPLPKRAFTIKDGAIYLT